MFLSMSGLHQGDLLKLITKNRPDVDERRQGMENPGDTLLSLPMDGITALLT
jgi:hypothetical protein